MITVEYIDHMGNDLSIVNAARISYGKRKAVLDEKDVKLIRYLAAHEHTTPFEHTALTVYVQCPLYARSQIMRHRTFAYNEISRRYTSEGIEFYIPQEVRRQAVVNKQGSDGHLSSDDTAMVQEGMKALFEKAHEAYEALLRIGVSREQARGVLPNALMTQFYMTGNLHNFSKFLRLRLDTHAQAEVQLVAQQIEQIIAEHWPVGYEALRRTWNHAGAEPAGG